MSKKTTNPKPVIRLVYEAPIPAKRSSQKLPLAQLYKVVRPGVDFVATFGAVNQDLRRICLTDTESVNVCALYPHWLGQGDGTTLILSLVDGRRPAQPGNLLVTALTARGDNLRPSWPRLSLKRILQTRRIYLIVLRAD